jgi:phage baseplate assembly protein gpV
MMHGAQMQLPQVIVQAGGQRLSQDELRGLDEVRVQQRLSMPSLCELSFFDLPGTPNAADDLAPGVSLWVGTRQAPDTPLFVGDITAVEHTYSPSGAHEVHVRGYDRLHQLRQQHQLRTFARATLVEVARQVAREYGLRIEAARSGLSWPLLIQHQQSDLELLVEISALGGLHLTLRGDILHLITLDGIGAPLPLRLSENLLEARLEMNNDLSRHLVTASGWDPLRAAFQTRIEAERNGLFNGRTAARQVGPGIRSAHHLVNEGTADEDHARALAQAEMDFRRTRETTLWGVACGDPVLRPGTPVEVTGTLPSLAGRYVLTEVTHLVNNRLGFVSEISSLPPAPRQRARGVTASVGVVSDVHDPDEYGRVKVRLPAYGDVETDWMGVLTPGAGPHKGLVIPPANGDTVLVLLVHEDPGQGIVLGGLYGARKVPDSGINLLGQVRRYTWSTPGGQRVQLDDSGDTIHLENGAGSYIKLDGDKVVIAGKAIDFRSR